MGIWHMVAMKLPANNVDGGTTACLKKLKNVVSTNNPTIHPRKNQKGTDDVNQTLHPAILFLFGRSIHKRISVDGLYSPNPKVTPKTQRKRQLKLK